jgi:NAD(P)-dependent dehydrogenase (short-subunit alcohol dehydrogenase family)
MAETSESIEGRVVMITGGGQGIGRAYALKFAEAGAIPVIVEIDGPPSRRPPPPHWIASGGSMC